MRKRLIIYGTLAFVALIVIFVIGQPMGRGSPRDAELWSARLAQVSSPEQATREYPGIGTWRFDDGTWLVAWGSDSHSSWRGGTLVTRDSSATVHAYLGHVCGRARYYVERVIKHPDHSTTPHPPCTRS